jgi:hypothetical protein
MPTARQGGQRQAQTPGREAFSGQTVVYPCGQECVDRYCRQIRNKEDTVVAIGDTASALMDAFGSFDRARLIRMSETDRARQLDARQLLYDYVDALWADVERAGERPAVGEKYQAIAVMRELIMGLRTTAFEAVYDTPE